MSKPIVQLKNVSKSYAKTIAVSSITMDVMEGEFFTLLGPSGCGKTTTLRIISGFVKPDAGDVIINGERVNERPPYSRNLGVVFQNYALFPHMTVFENVAYGLRTRKIREDEIRSKVQNGLDLVGLRGYGGRYPSQLSGGQQQRVALARAIVISPDVLLLDEPLSNLDLKLRQKMRRELKSIQRNIGITTIYVTHDQGEALAMSDRIAVMNEGRLVQLGDAREIYASPRAKFVAEFIGEANLFTGTISQIQEKIIIINIKTGFTFPILKPAEESKTQTVTVSIRPEKVKISRVQSTDGDSTKEEIELSGSISSIEYLGSVTKYYVELDSGDTVVSEVQNRNESHTYSLGESIFVSWNVDAAKIISDPTE